MNYKVSISIDFLKSFSLIPTNQQKGVREYILKFQNKPTSSNFKLQSIENAVDNTFKRLIIDNTYSVIIANLEQNNIFMLLWVDQHKNAENWAERKKLVINQETGALDFIEVEKSEVEKSNNQAEDYSKALNNYGSLSRFKVIEGNEELESLLNAPLEQWRVFLHPIQRKYVETDSINKKDSKGEYKGGSVRVLGSAGTGKTVVAVHRAKWLLENKFTNKDDRILFTTFTKNLAIDIKGYLQAICSQELMKRIDIQNIDAWTHNYLKKCGYSAGILLEDSDYEDNSLWKQALNCKPQSEDCNFSDQFYRDEWEQVIQPQSIFTLNDFFKASRTGRGRSINRLQRKKIWTVFEEYRALLDENNLKEKEDLYRDATQLLEKGKNLPNYKAVIVDEGQDLSQLAYSMIRKIVPLGDDDIFIVGDSHQRIYGFKAILSKSGINIVGKSRKLKVNYRTTEETYQYATAILNGISFDDLDGNEDIFEDCESITTGPQPELTNFPSREEEKDCIIKLVRKLSEETDLRNICITARTKTYLNIYEKALSKENIPSVVITTQSATDKSQEGVRLATMHRIKGIEFDYVILASACENIIPLQRIMLEKENPVDQKNFEIKERSLLYVACTRARKALFITSYDKPSKLL